MNFTRGDAYHVVSDCRRYVINKAGQGPGRICYMAVYRANKILGVWHCTDSQDERTEAYKQAVAACETHAGDKL